MGNQLGMGQAGGSLHDLPSLLLELSPNLTFRRNLGGGKVLKTIKCSHGDGTLVVKIYIRRDPSLTLLTSYGSELDLIATRCGSTPSLLSFISWHVSSRAAFLVRPFIASNLHERFHSRPFITHMEKAWITYSFLRAVEKLHGFGICHSDIKSENVLLTSFQWVILADVSSFFKPVLIPDDNPFDFHTFFDSCRDASQRPRCYIAPERFTSTVNIDGSEGSKLHPSMDIFSSGCVISEIFLEGEALFDLLHLLSYKKNQFDPSSSIDKIDCAEARQLVRQCIELDPEQRPTASECLKRFGGTLFPEAFPIMYEVLEQSVNENFALPDDKISHLWSTFPELLTSISGNPRASKLNKVFSRLNRFPESFIGTKECQSRCESSAGDSPGSVPTKQCPVDQEPPSSNAGDQTPLRDQHDHLDNGSTSAIPLPLVLFVCANMRNAVRSESKLMAIEMLESLAFAVNDFTRTNRIVPFIIAMTSDPNALVRAVSISVLTKVLRLVKALSSVDKHIWAEYIFPSLAPLPSDPHEIVKISFAQNIATLADTARRFFDMEYTDDRNVPILKTSEKDLEVLQSSICQLVGDALTASSSCVKIAILSDIARLGIFFGKDRCNNWLLPMLISVLNDRDWQLRAAFFCNAIGISIYVGTVAFQNFLLPCIEQALFDVEETVVIRALEALIAQVEIGLFEQKVLINVASRVIPLLCHPSTWIRLTSLNFICGVIRHLGPVKFYCFLGPYFPPFLHPQSEIFLYSKVALMRCLRPPLSRTAFISRVSVDDPNERHVLDAMMPYLNGVNAALQQRIQSKQANHDKTEAELLEKYVQLPESSHLYSIAFEHTVPDVYRQAIVVEVRALETSSSCHLASELNNMQGKSRQKEIPAAGENEIPSCSSIGQHKFPRLIDVFQKRLVLRSEIKYGSQGCTRHSSKTAPPGICPSLGVPLDLVDLGVCHAQSLSASWVYGNSSPPYDRRMSQHPHAWRPQGVLVTDLKEHRSAVTQMSVSRDNQFVCSASLDGSIRIWDCHRLEKSVSASSQLVHNVDGGVTSLTVCDASHSVAFGTATGVVEVFRIECTVRKDGSADRYVGATSLLKQESNNGPIASIQHANKLSESMLVYATENGRIVGRDLRSRQEAFSMSIPIHHGLLSHMQIGPSIYSIVTGSVRGYVSIFDARFHVAVSSWRHSSHSPISCLRACPVTSVVAPSSKLRHPEEGPLAFIGTFGDNTVTAFDLLTGDSRACFLTEENTNLPYLEADRKDYVNIAEEIATWPPKPLGNQGISSVLHCPGSWVITSSWNQQIMFWDLSEPRASYFISDGGGSRATGSYTGRLEHDVAVFQDCSENIPCSEDLLRPRRRGPVSADTSHSDIITHMVALQLPQKMLLTSSRDGRIKVWI